MSDPNDKPVAKQPKNQDSGPPNKRQKSDSSDEPVEMTNITDVNDNCLEHIFKHLTLSDLLNVYDTSKALNNAVCLVFKSKYGKHAVKLDYMKTYLPRKDRSIEISITEIEIKDFPTCLKMLRMFGDSITKLTTFSTNVPERERDELDRYLSEYCAESVVELEYGRGTLDHLTKSFTKVETVCFSHGHFRCEPANIQRCFPNLRSFTFHSTNSVQCVTGKFPYLEYLDIHVPSTQHENFAICLQLNPQLRDLRITGYNFNSKFLRILSECPQLESLYLVDNKTSALATINSDAGPISFKTVKKFETDADYLKRLEVANILLTFDQLDELTICGRYNNNIRLDVIRFISKHPFISKFNLKELVNNLFYTGVREEQLRLAKALPSVTELRCRSVILSADNVSDFIRECHLLKYFEFCVLPRYQYDALRKKLGTEWRSSIFIEDQNIVKLER